MRAVIFTCSVHLDRAEIAAERLALLGVQPIFALDLADRIPGSAFPVVRTEFPRRGNLNGGPCLAGMLDILAAAQGDTDRVLKIDSDMILSRISELANRDFALVGIRGSNGAMRGGAYALDARALAPALRAECLTRTSSSYPEAALLAHLSMFAGFRAHLLPASLMANPRALPPAPLPSMPLAWHCGLAPEPIALMRHIAAARHAPLAPHASSPDCTL